MANMTSEFLGKPNGLAQDVKNKAHGVENQFENLTFKSGEAVGSMVSGLVESTSTNMKKGREYVIENPVRGVAMAASAGFIVGSLITLIMRQKNK